MLSDLHVTCTLYMYIVHVPVINRIAHIHAQYFYIYMYTCVRLQMLSCTHTCCLQFQSGVQQFEFFMSGHMDILANDPSRDEIVQLALLQPNASEVFVQASARARGDRKKSWFKWRYKMYMYLYV